MNLDSVSIVLGLLIGLLGGVPGFIILRDRVFPFRRLSWKFAQKASKKIVEQMTNKDNFSPTVIIGIGRGGAIMGAFISGCLGHRPLLVIDRKKLLKVNGWQQVDISLRVNLPKQYISKVLLVAGVTYTGKTMLLFHDYLKSLGASEIKRAVLYRLTQRALEPEGKIEYEGIRSTRVLAMPWMFDKRYVEEGLTKEEPTGFNVVSSTPPAKTCFIVRHGQSTANVTGDNYSENIDCELTARGIAQANDVGAMLKHEGISRIYSGPLKHAVSTAEIIHATAGGAIMIDDRLREIDYGDWKGLTKHEIFRRWPESYLAYQNDPIEHYPLNGEDPRDAFNRVISFWGDIKAILELESTDKIVIVTHKSVIRMLLCHLSGDSLSNYRCKAADNGSIAKVLMNETGKVNILTVNSTSHLTHNV